MNQTLRLYFARGANCPDRVRWLIEFKQVPCELVDIDAERDAEFAQHSPFGQVPLLLYASRALSESMAISEFIEELFPNPPLLGASAWERARVREICEAVNSSIHPAQNSAVAQFYLPDLGKEHIIPLRVRWLENCLVKLAPKLWQDSGFAVGPRFTLADIYVASIYRKLRRMGGLRDTLRDYELHLRLLLDHVPIRKACPDLESSEIPT